MLWRGRFAGDGCTFTCTPCSINASLKLAHQSSSTRLQNAHATRSRHRTSAQLKCGIGVRQQQHARAMRLSRLRLAETRPKIGWVLEVPRAWRRGSTRAAAAPSCPFLTCWGRRPNATSQKNPQNTRLFGRFGELWPLASTKKQ